MTIATIVLAVAATLSVGYLYILKRRNRDYQRIIHHLMHMLEEAQMEDQNEA